MIIEKRRCEIDDNIQQSNDDMGMATCMNHVHSGVYLHHFVGFDCILHRLLEYLTNFMAFMCTIYHPHSHCTPFRKVEFDIINANECV